MNENLINSTSLSVQMTYQYYLEEKFLVNRKYQRKLVWTIEEKCAFIDSIVKYYSVPLFLFAEKENSTKKCFEIIDGMQRLNAIISYIENEFSIDLGNGIKGYFDLDTLSSTKQQKDKNILIQKEPIINRDICIKITNYPLPFSFINASEDNIEEIFRRINSFGKQLSNQEIRQAGAAGRFPQLVREVSNLIRGDVSPSDLLNLNSMKLISISNKRLNYGIYIDNIFWVKQGIITKANMRVSRDEELIAWIISYMIMDGDIDPSSHALNSIYQYNNSNNKLYHILENKLTFIGDAIIKDWYINIHNIILSILKDSGMNFKSLVFSEDNSEGIVRTYQVIFLSLFELVIKEKKIIKDIKLLVSKFKGIANKHLKGISSKTWNKDTRFEKVKAIKGILTECFINTKNNLENNLECTLQLETLLRKSRIEGTQYDFKTGLHNFDEKGKFNTELAQKIIKTLTAEANSKPREDGYVIIGITEGKDNFKMFQKYYQTSSGEQWDNSEFYITGVENEIEKFYNNKGDLFQNEILSQIDKAPIKEDVKMYIKTHFTMLKYNNHDIIFLYLKALNEPITFDDKFFVRSGNNTTEIKGASAITNFIRNFNS